MNDMTVVYYSSNREKPEFAEEVRKRLLKSIGDLPLISVTQKPIDFGRNICIGDVGISNINVYRQIQLGTMAAKTSFVAMAETDCLYPKEHFEFRPPKEDMVFRNTNLWILYLKHRKYRRKQYSLCNQIAGRNFLLENLSKCLKDRPMWSAEMEAWDSPGNKPPHIFAKRSWDNFETEIPCINVMHNDGMHRSTGTFGKMLKELPYWGNSNKLLNDLHLDPWPKSLKGEN